MSSYDELTVQYPLPDGWDPGPWRFRTGAIPAQWLERYVLTAEGRLVHEATGEDVRPHGAVAFSTDNLIMSAPWGVATIEDQPPWRAEYVAVFDHGQILKIEGGWRLLTGRPHLTQAVWQERQQAYHEWVARATAVD